MRTWIKKWALPGAGGLLLVALVVVPYIVEGLVATRADESSAGLPGSIEWRGVDWFWGTSVAFHGIQGDFGPHGSVDIQRAEVELTIGSLLALEPRIEAVVAHGLRANIDVAPKGDADVGGVDTEEDETTGPTRLPEPLRELSEIRLVDGRVDVARAGRPLGRWTGDVTVLGENRAEGSGTAVLGPDDSSNRISWSFEGRIDIRGRTVGGEVDLAPSEDAEAADPPATIGFGPVDATLGGFSFEVRIPPDRAPRGRIALRDYRVAVGNGEQPGLRAGGSKLVVERLDGRRFDIAGPSMDAVVAPRALLAAVGADSARRRASPGGASAVAGGPSSSKGAGPSLLARLHSKFVAEVDLTLEQLGLEIRVRGDHGWKSYRPAERIQVYKRGSSVVVAGAVAGGTMTGRASLSPGKLLPEAARFRLRGVELGEIPVVRKGRSLPNRGVRGQIGGKVDLTARLSRRGTPGTLREQVRGEFDLQWRKGWIEADGLAREPVRGIDTALDLTFQWQPELNRVRLRDSEFEYGDLVVDLEGRLVDWGLDPRLSVEARAREFDCQRTVRALPDELLGPYRDVAIDGKTAPVLSLDFPLDRPRDLSFDVTGFPGPCRVEALNTHKSGWPTLQFSAPLPAAWSGVPTATRTSTRHWAAAPDPSDPIDPPADLEPIPAKWSPSRPDDVFWLRKPFIKRVTEGVTDDARVRVGPGLDSYVSLESLPTHVAAAAYLSEEINFYDGGPWNTQLIQKALQLNFEESRFVYGGSTVTQQLVKNLFLTRRKTLARKVQEALISWRIQDVVSKDRVLELYLNCIEFGENVYGIGPAAAYYFQKSASELTLLEGVFLAVLKPAPWFGDKFKKRGSTPESGWWRDRIREIGERLVQKGFVNEKRLQRAKPFVLKWDGAGQYRPNRPQPEPEGASSDSAKNSGAGGDHPPSPTPEGTEGPSERGPGEGADPARQPRAD